MRLGMSRRLFAACEQLHYEDLAIAERTPGLRAEDQRIADEPADEEAEDQRRRSYSPSPPLASRAKTRLTPPFTTRNLPPEPAAPAPRTRR